ncbi:MAG: phosphotransferase [Streptosporangiales bacterium]|nr:phosphotransferase [Streptosporangiales bacterium]
MHARREELGPRLRAVVSSWRLEPPRRVRSPARGTNNWVRLLDCAGRRLVVRGYENLTGDQVAGEHALLAALRAAGLPFAVPSPVPLPDGRTWLATEEGPVAVFAWLPGERPDPSSHALERVGEALGRLDAAFADLDSALAPHDWRRDLAGTHPDGVRLTELGVDMAALHDLDVAYARLLDHAPTQLVHQDMALSNVLMSDGVVTALLDFELAGLDLRVADVVAALVQSGCTEPAPARPLARATALLRGYGRAVRLTDVEVEALPTLLRFRAAGALVWRYGRYRRGQSSRAAVAARLDELAAMDAWVRSFGAELVTVAGDRCGR